MENISRDEIRRQSGSVVHSAQLPEEPTDRRISHLADKMSLFQTTSETQCASPSTWNHLFIAF